VHVAAWTCFFLLPIVFLPRPRDVDFQFTDAMVWRFICIDAYLLLFYYSNTQFLIPRLLTKRKWLWYSLIIVALLFLFLSIHRFFDDLVRSELPANIRSKGLRRRHFYLYPFTGSSAVFFLVFTVSTCSRVIQEWLGIESKRQEIENEKLATELSFLKSQINPHFLFNTLNNIYSLALVRSEATADAVLKLSSIMRYVLSETKHETVALEKEIQFIKHYIELQKVRLTDKVTIEFIVEGETEKMEIAPLLLIPFVENAFKYGISTKEKSKLLFVIKEHENNIYFTSENRVVFRDKGNDDNTGIGLKNTKRRLELLYPQKHTLSVSEENNLFIVNLILMK
jgi:two-component system LytT family sensor kinase